MVDAFSKSKEVWNTYRSNFLRWREIQNELEQLRLQLNNEKATEDYRLFQLNELAQEDFNSFDVAEMEGELNLQQNQYPHLPTESSSVRRVLTQQIRLA